MHLKIPALWGTRLLVAMTITVVMVGCSSNSEERPSGHTDAATRSTDKVTLRITGDEYEHSGSAGSLAGTLGTECPPTHGEPSVPMECWTWAGNGLGKGTYVQVFQSFTAGDIAFTFTLARSRGGTITGSGAGYLESEDASGPQAQGHVRRFPHTMTLTGGTGRYAGVTGELTGRFTSKVAAIDPSTGIVHRRVVGEFVGDVRFPRS